MSLTRGRRLAVFVLMALSLSMTGCGYAKKASVSELSAAGESLGLYATAALRTPQMEQDDDTTRKIIRRAAIRAAVDDPRKSADTVSQQVAGLGGYVAHVKHTKTEYGSKTEMVLRVPADRLDEMRRAVVSLARDVLLDETVSEDVTKQYRDLEMTLRNYRAEEEQYLAIMKRAQKVSEVLEVTQKLSEVRGRIEQSQAELKSITLDIDMSVLTLELVTDRETQIAGVRWRPLVAIRESFYDALGSLGEFASAMMFILFHIPIGILWIVVIVAALLYGWKLVKLIVRLLPGIRRREPADVT